MWCIGCARLSRAAAHVGQFKGLAEPASQTDTGLPTATFAAPAFENHPNTATVTDGFVWWQPL